MSFCPNCGNKLNQYRQCPACFAAAEPTPKKNNTVLLAQIGIVALALLIACSIALGFALSENGDTQSRNSRRSTKDDEESAASADDQTSKKSDTQSADLRSEALDAQEMAEEFFDCIFGDPDVDTMMSMMPFDLALDAAEDDEREELEGYLDETADEMQSELDEMHEGLDEYNWDYSVEVTSQEEYDIDDLDTDYSDFDAEVEEAIYAQCEVTLSAEDEEDITQDFDLIFVRIDGLWYVDPSAMEDWA